MQTVYPGLVLFSFFTAIMLVVFAGVVLIRSEHAHLRSRWYLSFGRAISFFSLILLLFGLFITFLYGAKGDSLSSILIQASISLATLCAFYMLYETFTLQKEQNERERIIQHVQTRLGYHLQNVADMEIVDSENPQLKHKGRSGFRYFLNLYISHFERLQDAWQYIQIYAAQKWKEEHGEDATEIIQFIRDWTQKTTEEKWNFCEKYSSEIREQLSYSDRFNGRSMKHVFIALMFLILFFSKESLVAWFKKSYNYDRIEQYRRTQTNPMVNWTEDTFQDILWELSAATQTNYVEIRTTEDEGDDPQFITEEGVASVDMQVFFGHYFRNLFGLYKYIDAIAYEDLREECARLVKTQFSTYEQAVLFLNSTTPIGEKWELEGDFKFFSKYKVIENIPEGMLSVVHPKDDVYHWLTFEHEDYM